MISKDADASLLYLGEFICLFIKNIARHPDIETLNVSNNHIGASGMQVLCEALIDNCQNLKTLDVSFNSIGNREDGIPTLIRLLRRCPNLTNLHMDCNNFKSDDFRALSEATSSFINLENLSIVNINQDANRGEGRILLFRALPRCLNLTTLNLGHSWLRSEEVQALSTALPRCPKLTTLYLAGNGKIGDAEAQGLLEALRKGSSLKLISLDDCGDIDDEISRAIEQQIKDNTTTRLMQQQIKPARAACNLESTTVSANESGTAESATTKHDQAPTNLLMTTQEVAIDDNTDIEVASSTAASIAGAGATLTTALDPQPATHELPPLDLNIDENLQAILEEMEAPTMQPQTTNTEPTNLHQTQFQKERQG